MKGSLPVGASRGALDEQLERKLKSTERKRSWARRIFAVLPGVVSLFSGLLTLGAVFLLLDGEVEAGLWVGGICGFLTLLFGRIAWRWGRGLPPAKFMGTLEEQRDIELWDE